MSSNLRLYRRVVIWQPATGSILDLDANIVQAGIGRDYSESTQTMDDGSTWRQSNSTSVGVPLIDNDEVYLARSMIEQDCPVKMVAIGDEKSIGFYEATRMRLIPQDEGAGEIAADMLMLDTSVRYPDVADSDNLFSGIPWRAANEVSTAPEQLRSISFDSSVDPEDLTAIGRAETDLLAIENDDVKEALTGTTLFTLGTTSNANGIAYDGSQLWITESAGDAALISVNTDGTNETSNAYHDLARNIIDVAYSSATSSLYIVATSGNRGIDRIDPNSPSTLQNTFELNEGDSRAIAIHEGEAFIQNSNFDIEVWDVSQTPATYLRTYSFDAVTATTFWRDRYIAHGAGQVTPTYGVYDLEPQNSPWQGRTWTTPGDATTTNIAPDLVGDATNISSTNQVAIKVQFPVWNATIDVQFRDGQSGTGTIRALDWDRLEIASASVGTEFTLPEKTWAIEVVLDSAPRDPELIVTTAGDDFGPLEGEAISDCDSRATNPYWVNTAVNLLAENA